MKLWKLFLLCLLSSALDEDTVAGDIAVHQLERLVALLTSNECEDLLFSLSHPEENIFHRVERLSPDKNQLKPRAKRDASSAAEGDVQCRAALTGWLLKHGDHTYYDRLSLALQHIGRTDIAMEVGKNIFQDDILNMKRYVEDYHKYVASLNVPPVDAEVHRNERQTSRKRTARDLDWRDVDLVMETAPVPAYQKGLSVVALPVLYGILLGFGGTLLLVVVLLAIVLAGRHAGVAI